MQGCILRFQYFKRLVRDPWFAFSTLLAALLFSFVLVGPWIIPYDPFDISFMPLAPPSSAHWLGVNDGGMDIWSELLSALHNTAVFGLQAGLLGTILAITAGIVSAGSGQVIDQLLMRLGDILLSIPSVMILILLAALFSPPAWLLACVLAFLAWPAPSKILRAQSLVLNNSLHVKAARNMGASSWYVWRRHILPELFPLCIITAISRVKSAMFMEASLAFLGLLSPMRKSLGSMVNHGLGYYYMDIWLNWLMPPILCLCLLIFSMTQIGVSLEKIFDPRMREF